MLGEEPQVERQPDCQAEFLADLSLPSVQDTSDQFGIPWILLTTSPDWLVVSMLFYWIICLNIWRIRSIYCVS